MKRQALIDSLIADTEKVKKEVRELIALGDGVISTKPENNAWSVIECIEHLNIADAHYIWQFDQKLKVAEKSNQEDFKPGFLGNYFVKSIKPLPDGRIPKPMKTLQKFRPEIKAQYDTINKFFEDQDKLIIHLEKSKSLDLNRNKISSAIGKIITFKLGDAFRFLIGHNQRHVLQMQNTVVSLKQTVLS